MGESEEIPDYSGEETPRDEATLDKLHRLVGEQAKLELQLLEKEEELGKIKKRVELYREKLVPEVMEKLGLDDLRTKTGLKVALRKEIRVSLPQDEVRRARAFDYLRETGNDGIIKREITINYGRDSNAFADELLQKLEEMGVSLHGTVEHEWNINPQTLKKFVRDSLQDGAEIPLEDFGAFVQTFAEFDFAKKKERK